MSGRKLRLPLTSSDGQVTAFSSSHFTRMLNDVLHFLTVPRFSCIMKPSTFVSESGEFIFPRFALFFFFIPLESGICFLFKQTVMRLLDDTGSCTSVKVTALGLSEAQEARKPGESTGCKKTWTGSALLNFVNAAPLAGSVEK